MKYTADYIIVPLKAVKGLIGRYRTLFYVIYIYICVCFRDGHLHPFCQREMVTATCMCLILTHLREPLMATTIPLVKRERKRERGMDTPIDLILLLGILSKIKKSFGEPGTRPKIQDHRNVQRLGPPIQAPGPPRQATGPPQSGAGVGVGLFLGNLLIFNRKIIFDRKRQ